MKRACLASLWTCAFGATAGLAQTLSSTTQPASMAPVPLSILSLNDVKVIPADAGGNLSMDLTALPLNSPPIGGFQAQFVYTLTNEHLNDYVAYPSSSMGGSQLAIGSPQYRVAIFDTGSQSHLLSYADAQAMNLAGANLTGASSIEIAGASGTEFADVSDGLGVYVSGLGAASVNNGQIAAATTSFIGMTNTSILTAQQGSSLPSTIGTPLIGGLTDGSNNYYRVSIFNSQPKSLTVGSTTYRSPNVTVGSLSTSLPTGYSKLTLTRVPQDFGLLFGTPPELTPNFESSNYSDDPSSPTAWYTMEASGVSTAYSGSGTLDSVSNSSFLFDTGAQVSVISEQIAGELGFFTGGTNPSKPDFYVQVAGVGGTTDEVPGFYMDSLSISTNGGPITWHHVPVVVLNIPDPAGVNDYVDGILGMNLFTDRDLIINGTSSFVGISPQWQWNNASGGTWGVSTNWTLALPNGQDTQANFYGAITSPQTVVVDPSGMTVGTINFDNTDRYTINGPGTITMAVSVDQAQINVSTGSHTINAPITLNNDTIVTISQPTSRLTISSDVNIGANTLFKAGPGVLEMKNVRGNGLELDEGTLLITPNGGTNSVSRVSSLAFNVSTLTTAAHLDLSNNAMIVDYTSTSPLPTVRQDLANGYNGGSWNGDNGIDSSMANATTFAIGSAERSALGVTSFEGQSVTGPAVLIKYTYYGDANLDGQVDIQDLFALASHWNTSSDVWTTGDFNYDGIVNMADLQLLAMNWNHGVGNPLLAPLLTALGLPQVSVPEPLSMLPLALMTMPLLRRRRSRGKHFDAGYTSKSSPRVL